MSESITTHLKTNNLATKTWQEHYKKRKKGVLQGNISHKPWSKHPKQNVSKIEPSDRGKE